MVLIILYFEFMFLYEIIAEYTSMFKDKAFFDIIFMFFSIVPCDNRHKIKLNKEIWNVHGKVHFLEFPLEVQA